jgi:hypothetical protein
VLTATIARVFVYVSGAFAPRELLSESGYHSRERFLEFGRCNPDERPLDGAPGA